MNEDAFEQQYMESVWESNAPRVYKSLTIDPSVQAFYSSVKNDGKTLLDLGCGNGRNTLFFQKNGFECRGIDFAPSAIAIAQHNAQHAKVFPQFSVNDVLSFEVTHLFDVVLDCGTLHHIRKQYWPKYKKMLVNHTHTGSHFYLHGLSMGNREGKRNWVTKNGHYTHFFSVEEIEQFLGEHFRIKNTYDYRSNSGLLVKVFEMLRK